MGEVFSIILTMSIVGSIVALFVLIFRGMFKKIVSHSFIYILWGFVFIRFMFPISFESSFSIFNYIDMNTPYEQYKSNGSDTENIGIENLVFDAKDSTKVDDADSEKNSIVEGTNAEDINAANSLANQELMNSKELSNNEKLSVDNKLNLMNILGIIWVLVALVLLSLALLMFLNINRILNKKVFVSMVSKRLKVYESNRIDAPVIHGLLKPIIVLPSHLKLTREQVEDIITHELVHLKRLDHIVKPLWLVLVCVYWFNPLIWISYLYVMKDMELSCDEKVLKQLDHKQRCHYADTLLEISLQQNNIPFNGLVAFSENNIKSRIKSILTYKRVPLLVMIISPILIIALFVILVSQKLNNEPMEVDPQVREISIEETNNEPMENESILTEKEDESYYAYDMVMFSDGMVEIAGEKIAYKSQSMDSLLEDLSMAQIEQIMYRSVLFYKSAYNKDYEAMKELSSDELSNRIRSHEVDKRNYAYFYPIMNLSDYISDPFPSEIMIPQKYDDHYYVELKTSTLDTPSGKVVVFFTIGEDQNPVITEVMIEQVFEGKELMAPYTYVSINNLAIDNGYERGIVLNSPVFDSESYSDDYIKVLLLGKDNEVFGKAELGAKVSKTKIARSFIEYEDVVLNEKFLNHRFQPLKWDFSKDKYIVGTLSKSDDERIESSLIAIPKDDLTQAITLQSFEQPLMSQSDIPTIIEWTMVYVGDYLIYKDVDQYWKVQEISSGEILSSESVYNEHQLVDEMFNVGGDYDKQRMDDTYIYLATLKDGNRLVFNLGLKTFELLDL